MQNDELLSKFVQGFERSGSAFEEAGEFLWKQSTEIQELVALYERLPAKLPPLFESLLLSYRWRGVEIGGQFDLLPNPPGETLDGWTDGLFKDKKLAETCLQNGYIQFGFGPDWYNPLCFDLNNKGGQGEYQVVSLDHEQILSHSQIRIRKKVSPSFEQLVSDLTF